MQFLLQPDVYSTSSDHNLISLLSNLWIRDHNSGDGTIYIISGFANYNGGVRFYSYFAKHIRDGGKIVAILGGSQNQALSSIQIVEALLDCGVNVYIVNRKRLVHAKCYGMVDSTGEQIIVTSANFTGPGMSQNAEAALWADCNDVQKMLFSWKSLIKSICSQGWDIRHIPVDDVKDKTNDGWALLYDETSPRIILDDDQKVSMVLTLSASDTARIMADPGTNQAKGTQYFWLSKTSFDFFPALTILNTRGIKKTYSCLIRLRYVDLGLIAESRVTFEAENNLDFRLGTSELKLTKLVDKGDAAILTRKGEYDYELRLIKKGSAAFHHISRYLTMPIGNAGKMAGYMPNSELDHLINEGVLKS